MFTNYFKIAVRNLLRYRSYTLINIGGLTLGISCALFIFLIVAHELSYDRYHHKSGRIYRINKGSPGGEFDMGTPRALAPILREEFPEVEEAAVIFKLNPERTQIEIDHQLFRERETYIVEPQFFHLFDFVWLRGNPDKSLDEPNEVVISESMAKKYFKGDPIGKNLRLNNDKDLVVSGIIKDPPANTDFPVQIAIAHAMMDHNRDPKDPPRLDGGSNSFYQTYVLLKENADTKGLEAKFKSMVVRHVSKESAEKFLAFSAQPLTDIHFVMSNFNQRTIARETIRTLSIIGIFILVIGCINFINLASAQAIRRAREVGIRKTLGSTRKSLVFQFLGETFIVTLLSIIFSYIIVNQLTFASKNLTDIPLNPEALSRPETLFFLTALLIVVTFLSGFYPAFILSGFRPAEVLKNWSPVTGIKGLFVRKGLITFQFVISQVLIICTLIAIRQINYFNSRPLGFNKEAVLTTDIPVSKSSQLSSLENNLLQYPEILNVSFSLNTPAATINKYWSDLKHASFPGTIKSVEVKFIDSTYFKMYEIERVAGTIAIEGDSAKNVVVNETLVREIGLSDPAKAIGETINYYGMDATIVGVVRDFQTVTLHEAMHPVLLTRFEDYFQKVSVKINMNQASQAIRHLEKHWKEAFPGYYFTFAFLDDELATFYKEDQKISRLLFAFASVAIGIGCIGLFGLITFVSVQRSKEVGIRKILGATIANIATLLSKDFILLVFVAGIIAFPVAYFALDKWLQGFANHIDLIENSWIFILAAGLAILFALITTGFQSVKAALSNPVESLRNE